MQVGMDDFFEIVEKFMPSQDMRLYLKQTYLNYWQLVDIIYLSPVEIIEKQEGLKKLLSLALKEGMEDLAEYSRSGIEEIEKALQETKSEGIFTCEECIRDKMDDFALYKNLDIRWNNYEDAMHYILNESRLDKTHENLKWYEITKWYKDSPRNKEQTVCTYTIVQGKIWFTSLEDFYSKDDYYSHCMCDELYLPVPFTAGDIIEVDGYPYNPRKKILITSIGDNRDCCCVQGLSQSFDGVWRIGALKHGMIGDYRFPMIAPLFTAQRVKGLGKKIDNTQKRVSDFIKDDEAKAKQFEMLIPLEGITDDELNMFLDLELDEKRIETYLRRKQLMKSNAELIK